MPTQRFREVMQAYFRSRFLDSEWQIELPSTPKSELDTLAYALQKHSWAPKAGEVLDWLLPRYDFINALGNRINIEEEFTRNNENTHLVDGYPTRGYLCEIQLQGELYLLPMRELYIDEPAINGLFGWRRDAMWVNSKSNEMGWKEILGTHPGLIDVGWKEDYNLGAAMQLWEEHIEQGGLIQPPKEITVMKDGIKVWLYFHGLLSESLGNAILDLGMLELVVERNNLYEEADIAWQWMLKNLERGSFFTL